MKYLRFLLILTFSLNILYCTHKSKKIPQVGPSSIANPGENNDLETVLTPKQRHDILIKFQKVLIQGISRNQIESSFGPMIESGDHLEYRSPGMMITFLKAEETNPSEGHLTFDTFFPAKDMAKELGIKRPFAQTEDSDQMHYMIMTKVQGEAVYPRIGNYELHISLNGRGAELESGNPRASKAKLGNGLCGIITFRRLP